MEAATRTRSTSSDSTDSCVGASPKPASQSEDKNPLAETLDKTEFIMMPPEEKLRLFESRAQTLEDNQEFDACVRDLVRCLALTRVVHGDRHLKLAQAQARLAKAYFLLKGLPQQAHKHSALARELLSALASISTDGEETVQLLLCLLSVNLIQGGAAMLMGKNLDEAESCFLMGKQIVEELRQMECITAEERMQNELEIFMGLARVYQKQRRLDKAIAQCNKSLNVSEELGKVEVTCSIYKDMAGIEQDRGRTERAGEYLAKCLQIQTSLLGPQHKETKSTQRAMETLGWRADTALDADRNK